MKELFHNLKFAWIYAKDQKKRLIAYLFTNLVHIVISIIVPLLSARIIVNLTENAYL